MNAYWCARCGHNHTEEKPVVSVAIAVGTTDIEEHTDLCEDCITAHEEDGNGVFPE